MEFTINLNRIRSKSILVVGDVMLDTYYKGEVTRISPEAPVPVFRKKSENSVLGGAANVAANLVAADQNVSVLSVIGNDIGGKMLCEALKQMGINTELLETFGRNTTVKTRFMANHNQQLLRLDVEDTAPLTETESGHLLLNLKDRIAHFDLILVSDYRKGLLTHRFTQGVIRIAGEHGIPVIVDVKDPDVEKYKHAYLLKPNKKELQDLTGMPVESDEEIIAASRKLRQICETTYVLTTCGARGMVLVGDGEPYFISAVGQEVFDVTGAGDTTIAYLAACMVNDFHMREAVEIANYAAGIQVRKVGTSLVSWREVREFLTGKKEGAGHKIIQGEVLDSFRRDHENQRIVFTNGCFDILHIGHIRYMQEAARLGDILIIGLNSDASVKRLKGPERPVNSEEDRAELLCALGFVDYVTVFDEDTPFELISKIQPDVLVKGGDYEPDGVVGRDIVEGRGGKLVLIPFVKGKSTTRLLDKIRK